MIRKWFNGECLENRNAFYNKLNMYRVNKSAENRVELVCAQYHYKTCIRKCKYEHDKSETYKLVQAKHKNAKLYWNMLKESAGIKQSNIPINIFEQYF